MEQTAGEKTRAKILKIGLGLWPNITLQAVADKIGMTHATVLYHFPGGSLKDAVAFHAVEKGNSRVIVQLIASNHPAIRKMSKAQRAKHFKAV